MAYMQVRDVLAHVTKLRSRVRNKARRFHTVAADDIIASLLDRFEEHDRAMSGFQHQLVQEASPGVLDTWIQFTDTRPVEEEIADLGRGSGACDTEEFVQEFLDLDQRLLSLYSTAGDQCNADSVKEFFRKLVQMETQKVRANSWNVIQTQDTRRT